ncbi:mechanosensitive ion channel [Leucothrix sargassi]|nr:mechanosensitive ion channel [Leucothrix sargassi]
MNKLRVVAQKLVLLSLICLAVSGVVFAADESTESPLLPWPMRLEVNWWDDFSKADTQALEKRIEAAKSDLAFIQEPPEALALSRQVIDLLDQYYKKRSTPLPVKPLPPEEYKAQYTLAEVEQFVSERRQVSSEYELLKSDESQIEALLDERKQSVEQAVSDYEALQKASESNLLAGLKLIQQQTSQALVSLNSSVLDQRLKNQASYLARLKKLEEEQIERLVVLPETLEKAKQRWSDLQQQIEKARAELASLRDQELTTDADEEAKSQQQTLLAQKLLSSEARLYLLETQQLAQLLTMDISAFSGAIDNPTRDAIRKRQKEAELRLESNEKWLLAASARVEQEQDLLESIKDVVEKTEDKGSAKDAGIRENLVKEMSDSINELSQFGDDLSLLVEVIDTKLSMSARGAEVLVEKADDTIRLSWQKFKDWMSVPLFTINNSRVSSFGLVRFSLILLAGWALTLLFRHAVERASKRSNKGVKDSSVITLSRIFSLFFMGIALLFGFSSLGIDVTKLALVASALSIGIGFGLQNIINNFVSGIILLFERSMKVGDYIELSDGLVGEVREINIRSTVITTNNNIDIIVPNSEFVNSSVTNWTMTDGSLRIKLPFTVAYGTDKEHLREVILAAVLEEPSTLNLIDRHYPQVRLSGFGDSALEFDLVVWVKPGWSKRPGRVKAAYNWVIDDVLREHNFDVPFPHRDILIRNEASESSELILSSAPKSTSD